METWLPGVTVIGAWCTKDRNHDRPVNVSLCSPGFGLPPPPPVNSSTLGEPVPGLVTLPGVPLSTRASRTCAGVNVGLAASTRAAAPATCGDAIDVPEIELVAVSLVFHSDLMLLPGAKRSTQVPKL